ncbi:fumarylacetoacetate hydrolase family protein [Blastopirellula sp. JC732]|uniref:Fumarylacetoacetate hydrolase family protein n=1 Tax=Blastopirellula sediminis TaxID=2894196 RepID=A0A9X1MQ24_9BACT|nr:fumarylacetoacetate hydrolase family protein [Blastopirellula sediminis]MCC9606417.1 fumarylacetoacetate hydrolase family protein [Blastopirellula sediminis]MCC9630285.1 fumarylacetoacetate hydrolase family protein [Blastopirellula sediminis]
MKIVKYLDAAQSPQTGWWDGDVIRPLTLSLFPLLELANPAEAARNHVSPNCEPIPFSQATLLPPIEQHEVWAAGVTYTRSKAARMEESEAAADCYDRVYVSPRPELFMKATPHRVSGPEQPLRIRTDSKWNVPEPELGLVLNSKLQLVGYVAGNDMSSRDIEGENPLYLPQAKVYDQCCGLGPCIALRDDFDAEFAQLSDIKIDLTVRRSGEAAFTGSTDIGEMARTFADLIGYLGRDNSFPNGAILLTGTGVIPDSDFTLLAGDVVEITIAGIGTLRNPIVQG